MQQIQNHSVFSLSVEPVRIHCGETTFREYVPPYKEQKFVFAQL